jgi:hypothetical protein
MLLYFFILLVFLHCNLHLKANCLLEVFITSTLSVGILNQAGQCSSQFEVLFLTTELVGM